MRFFVTIEKCSGCGTCSEICPTEAIRIEDGKAVITMDCIACGACPRVCPEGAIKMRMSPAPAAMNEK
jgi:Fe-S-cluster-containing hydrogenase component 2